MKVGDVPGPKFPANTRMVRECATWEDDYEVESESGRGTYTVSLMGSKAPGQCTCRAFQFSRESPQTCKHVKQVLEKFCLWTEMVDKDEIGPDNTCPRCGGPTVPIKRDEAVAF